MQNTANNKTATLTCVQNEAVNVQQVAHKWYVGDKYDNFDCFATAAEASAAADELVEFGCTGIYVLLLTEAEFNKFCVGGGHTVGGGRK